MDAAPDNDLVRQQSFDCDGPVELDIELGPGLVEVRLVDEAQSVVHVEVRHAPRSGGSLGTALGGLLSWIDQFGGRGDDLAAQAVRETTIVQQGQRVVVHAPRDMPLRKVPLGIVVTAPPGSAVAARAGSADVRVTGVAGRSTIEAGSGDVSMDRAEGSVQVRTGSGSATLGKLAGSLSARSGSGDLAITELGESATIGTGSGDVWIGCVQRGDVTAKTGSGDLTITDAAGGRLELTTGSGDLRVGIRAGVMAELDLSTGSGRARSELPVTDGAAPEDAQTVVWVRGRTGSGDAVVTRAMA